MRNASVHASDLRALFQSFGMGEYHASLAIQSAFFLPRTTDPDAQVTIALVKGVQHGLNELGGNVPTNGILGRRTMDCLRVVSGPMWHGKAWAQIYGDLDAARQQGLQFREEGPKNISLGDYVAVGSMSSDAVSMGALGLAAYLIYRTYR